VICEEAAGEHRVSLVFVSGFPAIFAKFALKGSPHTRPSPSSSALKRNGVVHRHKKRVVFMIFPIFVVKTKSLF
jgi:hypothetical protein